MEITSTLKAAAKVKGLIERKIVIFSVILMCCCFLGIAYAISPENHRSVTRIAIKEYRACTEQLRVQDSLSEGKRDIENFTKLEDESPLIKRFFNWHFYDAYRDTEDEMGLAVTGARKSMHHIYTEHENRLIDAIRKKRKEAIYEYTGRLLHLIQDMTVPAHVAPIYHYKFFWFDESDNFDEMPEWSNTTFTKPDDLCQFDKVDISDLKQRLDLILDRTALETRARMREKIPIDDNHRLAGKTWQEFWIIRKPDDDSRYSDTYHGFAPYGNEGREGFKKLCQSPGSGQRACLDFFKKSFHSAVTSTVKTLLLVNSVNIRNINVNKEK